MTAGPREKILWFATILSFALTAVFAWKANDLSNQMRVIEAGAGAGSSNIRRRLGTQIFDFRNCITLQYYADPGIN